VGAEKGGTLGFPILRGRGYRWEDTRITGRATMVIFLTRGLAGGKRRSSGFLHFIWFFSVKGDVLKF